MLNLKSLIESQIFTGNPKNWLHCLVEWGHVLIKEEEGRHVANSLENTHKPSIS